MNFSNGNPEEDMSMEDILSSIRKYVSEESEKRGSNEPAQPVADSEGMSDRVIRLDASHMVSEDEPVITPETRNDESVTYNERSTLSTSVVDSDESENTPVTQKKAGPFAQLANALNSYGKAKPEKKDSGMTVNQLFTEIAERAINDWVEKNMPDLVEQIVAREIEKMKAE